MSVKKTKKTLVILYKLVKHQIFKREICSKKQVKADKLYHFEEKKDEILGCYRQNLKPF